MTKIIQEDFVFVLNTRGYVTDCTVTISSNRGKKHVRTVAMLSNDQLDRNKSTV